MNTLLLLFALFYPTMDRFIVSSADCTQSYLQWDERSVDMDVYNDAFFIFDDLGSNEIQIYRGEYLNFTSPEWWWTPFDGNGKKWDVSGYAITDIGLVETFNHIEIDCSNKAYLPFVRK